MFWNDRLDELETRILALEIDLSHKKKVDQIQQQANNSRLSRITTDLDLIKDYLGVELVPHETIPSHYCKRKAQK